MSNNNRKLKETLNEFKSSFATNEERPSSQFIRREAFKNIELDFDGDTPKPVDFWNRPQYGLFDENQEPIQPKDENLKEVPSNPGEMKFLLNFVADAFNDFHEHFKNARSNQRINTESDIVYIKAYRAWVDANERYYDFTDSIFQIFVEEEIGDKYEQIDNFDDYVDLFIENMTDINEIPFARIQYYDSEFMTPFASGLVVEVLPKKYGNHQEAIEFYIDNNYEFYANSARKFGFSIDKNAPWRLYADLSSPEMQKYMKDYNINSPQQAFDDSYHNLLEYELDNIKDLLVEYYNQYVSSVYSKNRVKLERCHKSDSFQVKPLKIKFLTEESYNRIQYSKILKILLNLLSAHGSYEWQSRNASFAQRREILQRSMKILDFFGQKQAVRFLLDYTRK